MRVTLMYVRELTALMVWCFCRQHKYFIIVLRNSVTQILTKYGQLCVELFFGQAQLLPGVITIKAEVGNFYKNNF